MDAKQPSLKKPAMAALAALGILLIGAVVFFQERLFADTSFVAFNIINYKSLAIQNRRYGSFITQIIPFIESKFHLRLTTILFSYSVSFNLFFFSAALLIAIKFKQYGLTVLMALFYLLLVSESYFWDYDELLQGITWMFLFFATILYLGKKEINKVVFSLLFFLLGFFAISSHFITIIPTIFLWIYFIIEKKNWPFSKKMSIILSCFLVGIIALKFLISQSKGYDDVHLHGITHFSLQDIIDSFSRPVVKIFLYRCVTNYWLAVIVFILGIVSLIRTGGKMLAWWAIISIIGYLILMGITYASEDSNTQLCYIEIEWQSLGIIAATPFVFSYLPKLKPSISVWLLIVIFITRLIYIAATIPSFTWRVHFNEIVLAQMKKKGINKLAFYMDNEIRPKYKLDWAAGYESLFSSAMKGDKPQLTFCFVNKDDSQTLEILKNPKGFYDAYYSLSPENINHNYFIIDTTQPYQIMTYQELFK